MGTISFPLIAKPRDGFASKDIEILLDEHDLIRVSEKHIIQELAIPHKLDPLRQTYLNQINKRINAQIAEISIQIVTDKNGKIVGKMASYNKLNNGVPIEIIPYENEDVWAAIDPLLPTLNKLGHRGPLNIQGRLTDQGLKLFEMNARFTGITGLRAIIGFNEVEYCLKSWLGIPCHDDTLCLNHDRFGIRQTTDKIVSLQKNQVVANLSQKLNQRLLKTKQTVMITGASGCLGQTLIDRMDFERYTVWALGRDKSRLQSMYQSYKDVQCYGYDDIPTGDLRLGLVDTLIHCGFARPHKSNEEIAESLHLTKKLYEQATKHQIPNIINISSQSVYGTKQPLP